MPNTAELRVVAAVTAKPGMESTLAAAIEKCVGPSRAEPGCLEYTPYRDATVAGRFVFLERWTNRAALDAHTKTPHFLALSEVYKTAALNGVDIMILDEI
jgi:quinol monooxygenase YgiN